MKLICPDCGKQYDSGKFCSECGTKLQEAVSELVCPSCGTKVKSGKFCPECGTKLTEQSIAPTEILLENTSEPKFNEKDPRFAKYYDRKGFPRTIPQEEYAVAIEELTPFVEQNNAEAKMLLGYIQGCNGNSQGAHYMKEAEKAGDKIAYYLMGILYFYGSDIVEQNHSEAERRMLEAYQEYKNGEMAGFLAQLYTFSEEICDYSKAFKFATIAAEDDEMIGYQTLGALYLNGWGVEKNVELALENYKMAAAHGNEMAMNQIGYIFSDEWVEADYAQAFFWFNEASKKNSDVGMYNLGMCYKNGWGVEVDAEIAAEWFKKAADMGYVEAMCELGDYYQDTLFDIDKSKMWFLKAAELGSSDAQNRLGVFYANDINPDYAEAVKWFKKAMEQNQPNAFRNYAWCLWNGNGVEANKELAIEMMQQAISLGHPDAEKELQEMQGGNVDETIDKANEDFQNGKKKEAVAIYKRYAEEGNLRAMAYLGLHTLEGAGVKQNLKLGTEWLTNAANAGNSFACCRLVEAYSGADYNGKSVKADTKLAKKYLELAKTAGADENEIKVLEKPLIPSGEFSNIQIKSDVTINGSLGFQVSGRLVVKGFIGEKLEFSAYCIKKGASKSCLSRPSYCIERKYNESLTPDCLSTVWEEFRVFIPYKTILSKQAYYLNESLYIIVWYKEGKKNKKLLQVEQPFYISCTTHMFRSDEYFFEYDPKLTKWCNQ